MLGEKHKKSFKAKGKKKLFNRKEEERVKRLLQRVCVPRWRAALILWKSQHIAHILIFEEGKLKVKLNRFLIY